MASLSDIVAEMRGRGGDLARGAESRRRRIVEDLAEAAMRHFKIYTRAWGNHDVDADTKREAVAKLVARLGLKECECAGVGNWAISERQVRND